MTHMNSVKSKKIAQTVIILSVIIFGALFPANINAQNDSTEQNDVHLHMFYGQGCPHCANLKLFLDNIKDKYPSLIIHEHEVYQDQQERELFERMSADFNKPIQGVPTVFIDDKVIVGFSNTIGESIEEEIKRCLEINCNDPEFKLATPETTQVVGESSPPTDPEKKEIMEKLTIPIVIFAAAVDAINPCAFAVLIILMTAALSITDKKRALKFGLAFSISIYIAYFLMGCGLFSALQISGLNHTFYIIVTILAVVVGLLNIKDYFWYGKGFLMEVPLSWRPTMKKILHSATTPFGAFIAGLAVSLFELPCTGGPYIVILGLLAKEVTRATGFLYLLLYNLVFISPLIILSLLIYKGLSTTTKLEELRKKRIKSLHLIAGVLMLIIAAAMIVSLVKGWV
jgi:cytochrome c biogenesis protein CcdA/glutaredoxin